MPTWTGSFSRKKSGTSDPEINPSDRGQDRSNRSQAQNSHHEAVCTFHRNCPARPPAQGRRLGGQRIRERDRGLEFRRPVEAKRRRDGLAVDFRADIRGPAVAHFVSEVPNRVIEGGGLPAGRCLFELMQVRSDVVTAADGGPFGAVPAPRSSQRRRVARILVGICLVCSGWPGSGVSGRAPYSRCPRCCRPPGHHWRTRFLAIHPEIGVVGQKIELVAESLNHGAREILRSWHVKVVERFVHTRKRNRRCAREKKVSGLGLSQAGKHRVDPDDAVRTAICLYDISTEPSRWSTA